MSEYQYDGGRSNMPVTYTNRKGKTYYLCQGTMKTGRAYYYFAPEPKGEPLDEIPAGYEIRESANGFLSLAKVRTLQILPKEREAVEAAVRRHRHAEDYRVQVRGKEIVVHERTGPDADQIMSIAERIGGLAPGRREALREMLDREARFAPVMRFALADEEKRTFYVERWCYSGSINGWAEIGDRGPLRRLARRFIPKLSTHELFEIL